MTMEDKIKRINELYHKSKSQGLNDEEKEEQARLRQAYIESIRMNLKSQLDNIVIEKPDGTTVDLGETYGRKSRGKEKNS